MTVNHNRPYSFRAILAIEIMVLLAGLLDVFFYAALMASPYAAFTKVITLGVVVIQLWLIIRFWKWVRS